MSNDGDDTVHQDRQKYGDGDRNEHKQGDGKQTF